MSQTSKRKYGVVITCLECGKQGSAKEVFEKGNYCKNPYCDPVKGEDGLSDISRERLKDIK